MQRFDKKKFDENNINGEYNFVLPGGKLVRQVKMDDSTYVEYARMPSSPRETYTAYYASTLTAKQTGDTFYGDKVGVWSEFNERGEQTKMTDTDKPYGYTLEMLIERLKKEGINVLIIQDDVTVHRSIKPSPYYVVTYPVKGREYDINIVKIDGNNGQVLSQEVERRDH